MLRFLFIYIYDKWSELSWVKEKSFYLISSDLNEMERNNKELPYRGEKLPNIKCHQENRNIQGIIS